MVLRKFSTGTEAADQAKLEFANTPKKKTRSSKSLSITFGTFVLGSVMLGGCLEQRNYQGYQIPHDAVQQVPVGSSADQALLALGTPTTTATFGNEVHYYISQVSSRPVAFARTKVVDQRILAVYFDENNRVSQIANYGLQDGRVFDFVSRTTPTGGSDVSFVSQLLSAAGRTNPIGN